jgi:zinc protease
MFIVVIAFLFQALSSQPSNTLLPLDSAVVRGSLDNGLTYLIRKNGKPKDRVELRLVVKTGSIHEDEKQLGLAHFVEHMAFNGTASFKENELVAFLQESGVEFGADLNAYTSFNETVYILPLPKTSLGLIEKGMTVLYEWAGKITFDPLEIDRERGIVVEEWRSGRGAEERLFNKQIGVLLHNSRYAERLPIGSKEILETFNHDDLKRFYRDWYRPELMTVIVTGDIDPVWAEKKIRSIFSKLPKSAQAVKLPVYDVPGHAETLVSIETDIEATGTQISLSTKHPKRPFNTEDGYRERLKRSLYNQVLNARFRERAQEAVPPFLFAFSSYSGGISPSRDFYDLGAFTADTALISGFRELMREAERVRRFGFSENEVKRAKAAMLRSYEKMYQERANTDSDVFASELVDHAVEGEPVPGIAFEYAFAKKHLPDIRTEEISKLAAALLTDENRVILVTAPQKEGLKTPSKEELLNVISSVKKEQLNPWKETKLAESLLPVKPAPGTLVRRKTYPDLGITEWKLSNGVNVVLKPTTFKADQILMTAHSPGGYSTVSDTNFYSALMASALVQNSGAGEFRKSDLEKFLAGKVVGVRPSISQHSEGFSGQASPRDLETLFQLVTLYATSPRSDADAFANLTGNYREFLRNIDRNPEEQFSNKVAELLYGNNRWARGFTTIADLDKANADSAMAVYKNRFADFSDFTFFFTGAFTLEQLQPLALQYLGSLPALKRGETFIEKSDTARIARVDTSFAFGLEPKAYVQMSWSGPMVFNPQTRFELNALTSALDIILINEIREKMSGVYGISAGIRLSKIPRNMYSAEISFPCAPENADAITKRVREILAELAKNGPSEADLAKVRETYRQQIKQALETNEFWHRTLTDYYINGLDLKGVTLWEKRNKQLNSAALARLAAQVFDSSREKRFVMLPAATN